MSDTWKPGSTPETESKSEQLTTTEARQGVSGLGVRYVLAISLSAILTAFAILYFVYAGP